MYRFEIVLFVLIVAYPAPGSAKTHKLGFSAHLDTYFTTNLYHTPTRRLGQFETRTDPGERFHNMRGPGDVVTQVGVDGTWRYRLARKKYLRLKIDAEYVRPLLNDIAQYFEVGARLDADLTRRDRLRVGGSFSPSRFWKNYRDPTVIAVPPALPPFARADATEFTALVDLRHRFKKHFAAGGRYELYDRGFNALFANRDRTAHEGTVYVKLGFGKRVDVGIAASAGVALSPGGVESGEIVDRSFQTLRGQTWLDLNLRKRWTAGAFAEFRQRRYTTSESSDDGRFNRNDSRLRVGADARKGLGKTVYLAATAEFLYSLSNRESSNLDAVEAGYVELVAGVRAGVRF